ncbi:hypothetical protein [Limnoglobus roseus]|uniref:Uncharacterized protein n=1 Tax=Limnoglobus roseus TaxID=2598579 RepID=A0A5C1AC99_9BACT|nr:hypothetical protein [Limnoglobus roseus]QEL17009.1 hypothetical protein PX52LOC_03985 [Limnoglobus roseus]
MDSTTPPITSEQFESLRDLLNTAGPKAAVAKLCDDLRAAGDYHSLFYALLMKKRVELGVSPFPTGPSNDLPPEAHEPYEGAIRDAAREVGNIYLKNHEFAKAWGFFRLIGEPGPVKAALDAYEPGPDDDTYPVVDIAWHQQVHPRKGFDIYLSRHGICSTITMVGGTDLNAHPDLRTYCYTGLARTLHEQLSERLRNDLESHNLPVGSTIGEMLKDELFGEDVYHIDVSHLSSVVQMALQLPLTETAALEHARDLSAYGQRLARQFQGDADAPFENTYADYSVYLDILLGRNVEVGLQHFEAKVERELEEGNSFPAEVYINLLLKLDRKAEALAAGRKYLSRLPDDRGLSCPSVMDLARQVGDYPTLALAAQEKGDPVMYLAGLIARPS